MRSALAVIAFISACSSEGAKVETPAPAPAPVVNGFRRIVFCGGVFAAREVRDNAAHPEEVVTSTDAAVWTTESVPRSLYDLTCDGRRFFGVGDALTLSDAGYREHAAFFAEPKQPLRWDLVTVPGSDPLLTAAARNHRYLAAGYGIVRSEDGVAWSNVFGFGGNAHAIAAGDAGGLILRSVRIRHIVSYTAFASLDDEKWEEAYPTAAMEDGFVPTYVAFGAGRYVVTGGMTDPRRANESWVSASTDPRKFEFKKLPFSFTVRSVRHLNGVFVVVGSGGYVLTSPDGETWSRQPSIDPTADLWDVAYGNGEFVAVGTERRVVRFTR